MTTDKAYLLIEKWFGQNHPLSAQMLAMLLDESTEGELSHDINYQDEFNLDSPECECSACGSLMSNYEEHHCMADIGCDDGLYDVPSMEDELEYPIYENN